MERTKDIFGYMRQCSCEDGFCNQACWNFAWIDKSEEDDDSDY